MTKISVAVATFNEEQNIGKCLESVVDWVDEIVVVDGSSSDDTVGIAKKYKAKVILSDNPPIFHINKQKAIDACSGKWILQLDADEVVTIDLKEEILEVVNNQLINGYWIPRKNYFLGRFLHKGGQYPDYTLRLYRRGKGKLPCKDVHEQAIVEGNTAYLKNPLLHYPYPTFGDYLEHYKRYTTLISRQYKEKKIPKNIIYALYYIKIKPIHWFLLSYFRHKGILDGFPGFIFSFFSSLRFAVSYIKYWRGNYE